MVSNVRIVGVAGGSCSGKTSLVRHIRDAVGADDCAVVWQDSYYHDCPEAFTDNLRFNFDHPTAIDFELLAADLAKLRAGGAVCPPTYDFVRHVRVPGGAEKVGPRRLILVDGILILTQPMLLELFDASIFVECSDALRLARRLRRDVEERGRERNNIIAQFESQVRPMHDHFVEPSKDNATLVLRQQAYQAELAGDSDLVVSMCRRLADLYLD